MPDVRISCTTLLRTNSSSIDMVSATVWLVCEYANPHPVSQLGLELALWLLART